MKARAFYPGTIIKCKVCLDARKQKTGTVYAIAPGIDMEINAALRTKHSDEGDIFGLTTDGKVCTYIGGLSNDYEKATLQEALKVVSILSKDPNVQSFVMLPVNECNSNEAYINVDPDMIIYKGHKVYTKYFKPDELVLIRQHPAQCWTLAHYSHCADNNIHIVQPGVPVREILPYKGNEKLLSK